MLATVVVVDGADDVVDEVEVEVEVVVDEVVGDPEPPQAASTRGVASTAVRATTAGLNPNCSR